MTLKPQTHPSLRRLIFPLLALPTLFAGIGQAQDDDATRYIDLGDDRYRQVVVDHEPGQYLGHPTTVLLDDGRTLLTVYPKGHGKGGIVYKRSTDGGLSWSERLPTPESWATSREVPTLFRVTDAAGKKRLIMFSGLYPIRMAVSEDDGENWSELEAIGDFGGIVAMGCLIEQKTAPGHYLALFHDDGRFIREGSRKESPVVFTLYQCRSTDGGLSWSQPEEIYASSAVHLCEPGVIRSPDGKQLAVLLRENSRKKNSHVIFSNDEGKTWSEPRELPITLSGDRHTGQYGPDGRLFISFRGITPGNHGVRDSGEIEGPMPNAGDWAGWVGRYEDIVNGTPGQYVLRLMDNHRGHDTTYPGVEILPDGTFVTVTYGHWTANESPYIMAVRFTLDDLDRKAEHAPILKFSDDSKKVAE